MSNDKFKYQLSFDKAVEITNLNEFNIELHNEYADFHSALKKMDDTNYIFDSFLEIKTDKVDAQKIKSVEDISKAIDKFTNTKLIVKQL